MRASSFTIGAVSAWVAALCCPVTGPAQQVFHGELMVVATGVEEPVDEVPLPVTVITREEIDDSQESSIAELLRRVPGVTVARSGDRGAVTSVFTRGTESDHTLVLFDGVRLNSPYFGGYDWSLLPSSGIGRVEVARGPYSALWGADAVGGVVNLVPRRGRDGLQASLLGEAGGGDWRRVEGAAAWAGGGLDVAASAVERSGRGELANSDFSSRQLLLDLGWSWGGESRVAVLVQDLASEVGIPFSSPGSLTPDRRQWSDQSLLAVPVRLRLAGSWKVEVAASRVARRFSFRDPDDPFGFAASDTDAETVELRLASHHLVAGHALSWGGEWREDEVSDSSSFGANLESQRGEVASLFVQDVWRPGDDWRLVAGLRWDDADAWGSELSPRLAAGWALGDTVELRAAYGRAFRQPSLGELYFPFSGNPELEAERSESLELGAEAVVGASRVELNLFATRIDNLIEFDYAAYAFANVAGADIRGIEGCFELPLAAAVASSLSATWLDSSDDAGQPLLRRPSWSASWTVHGAVGTRLRGDLTLVWVGSRDDVDPSSFERVELPGHLTADLAGAFALARGLELTLRLHNLGDRSYEEIAGYPAPGRRLIAGVRWQHR